MHFFFIDYEVMHIFILVIVWHNFDISFKTTTSEIYVSLIKLNYIRERGK